MSAFMCDAALFQEILNRLVRDHTCTVGRKLLADVVHNTAIHRDLSPIAASAEAADKMAELVVYDWMKANHLAVQGRYPDSGSAKFTSAPCLRVQASSKVISLHQLYKHLECLHYQCANDLPENTSQFTKDWFDLVYAEIGKAKAQAAAAIVEGSSEYAYCGWGSSVRRTPSAQELQESRS